MRVVFLVTRAEPVGGVQIHIRDLASGLRERGHDVCVLVGGEGAFLNDLGARGIPTRTLRHLTLPIQPFRDLRALGEIRRALKSLHPDLIALHSSKAGILGRLAGSSLSVPTVLTAHGWTFTPGFPRWQAAVYRQIERLAGPLATRIITVSEFDRKLALDSRITTPDRIVAVYNGIPDIPPSLQAQPQHTPVRLIMIARFEPQKDHSTLLRSLAGLRDLPWTLDLVGDGRGLARAKLLAESLGFIDRVRFLGQRSDVPELLATAQVSVLVSRWEGFPLSILEAMRSGLPVVATSTGGTAEAVVDGETGYLVPPGDVRVLRDRIARLLVDGALRSGMGSAGRGRYEKQFTLEPFVTRTLAVFQDAITNKR